MSNNKLMTRSNLKNQNEHTPDSSTKIIRVRQNLEHSTLQHFKHYSMIKLHVSQSEGFVARLGKKRNGKRNSSMRNFGFCRVVDFSINSPTLVYYTFHR